MTATMTYTQASRMLEAEKQAANYRPPDISIGDDVLWYADPDNLKRSPIVAKVTFVGPRVVELVTYGASITRRMDSVRHITDPDFILKPSHKQFGGWDYTRERKDTTTFRNALDDRFSALEQRIEKLESRKAGKAVE